MVRVASHSSWGQWPWGLGALGPRDLKTSHPWKHGKNTRENFWLLCLGGSRPKSQSAIRWGTVKIFYVLEAFSRCLLIQECMDGWKWAKKTPTTISIFQTRVAIKKGNALPPLTKKDQGKKSPYPIKKIKPWTLQDVCLKKMFDGRVAPEGSPLGQLRRIKCWYKLGIWLKTVFPTLACMETSLSKTSSDTWECFTILSFFFQIWWASFRIWTENSLY